MSSNEKNTSSTDVYLDIIHVHSTEHIRIYLTTLSLPACSLGFIGTVHLKNFKLSFSRFHMIVNIDWHNCLLLYNDYILLLPDQGTVFPSHPNLLTDFTQPGPYNVALLARHMDDLIHIPHIANHEFLGSDDEVQASTPNSEHSYAKVHQIVKNHLSKKPSSVPLKILAPPQPSLSPV